MMADIELKRKIDSFKIKRILLIGDTIIDVYVYCKAIGKSLETPTIVAREERTEVSFGGAALVARNILELGGKVAFYSLIGDDDEARHLSSFLHKNLDPHFFVEKGRRTTVKKRFWVDGYKMLQVDNLDNRDAGNKTVRSIQDGISSEIEKCDAVVISDYRHGLMTPALIAFVKQICKEHGKNIFVDSQISHREGNHVLYKDCYFVLLSEKEALSLDAGFSSKNNYDFRKLSGILGESNICVKLGEKGAVCHFNGIETREKALDVKAIDTTGAGDAFLAAFCLSDMSDIGNALKIANAWAGLSVAVHGTMPPKKEDLVRYLEKQ